MCQAGVTNPTSMPVRSDIQLPEQSVRIKAWRDKVLAADARKARSASDALRLTLRPPSLTVKEARNYWLSESLELVIWHTADLNWLSNISSAGWSLDRKHRNRCRTLGAHKYAPRKSNDSLELCFSVCQLRWDHVLSRAGLTTARPTRWFPPSQHDGTNAEYYPGR